MSENLPQLLDIRVTIDGPTSGSYRITTKVFEYASYPPDMHRGPRGIVFDDGSYSFAGYDHTVALPEEYFSVERLPEIGAFLNDHHLSLILNQRDKGTVRVTFDYDDPHLNWLPWESLVLPGLPVENQLSDYCLVLRRYRADAGEFTGPLDLPINVGMVNLASGRWEDVALFEDMLFDGFVQLTRRMGGINWGFRWHLKNQTVTHLVFDSSDILSLRQTEHLLDGMTYEDPHYVKLLVLHSLSELNFEQTLPLPAKALERGADAVLLATQAPSDPPTFFHTFYRKMMHNLPLDQCVWEARRAANRDLAPVNATLMARKDGEFGLLLTRTVLENVMPLPAAAAPPYPEAARDETVLHRFRRRRGISKGKKTPESSLKRIKAIKNELLNDARSRLISEEERTFHSTQNRLKAIGFDQEEHGVHQILRVREDLQAETHELQRSEEALDAVDQVDDDTLRAQFVRWTNLWLTDRQAAIVTPTQHLIAQQTYNLHLQIGPQRADTFVTALFNETPLKKVFEVSEKVTLDVMFFCTSGDFAMQGDELESVTRSEDSQESSVVAHAKLVLPRVGPSNELRLSITPQQTGQRRLRTCIYYRNVMLQSLILEAAVIETKGEAAAEVDKIRNTRATDYLATTDFALLNELPQPSINLFTNQDVNGTHWVGVFSNSDTSAFGLKSGAMSVFNEDTLKTRTDDLRTVLADIQGSKNYKLQSTFPLSDADTNLRDTYLCNLAVSGWRLFHALFKAGEDDNAKLAAKFPNFSQQSHIISIARCGRDGATVPWAAMYTNPLDVNSPEPKRVCGIFKKQLAENVWTTTTNGVPVLAQKKDLLDDPVTCRSQPHCPLNDPEQKKLTVCPFGFWGLLHQIEQPLQQVAKTAVDEVPQELKSYHFGQTSFLTHHSEERIKIALGLYTGIPQAKEHSDEIQVLGQSSSADVDSKNDRQQIMRMMLKGKQHVYYFYCHGEFDKARKVFRLKVGQPGTLTGFIESADLDPPDFLLTWNTPQPLVVMNGCETMAITPDATHGFLYTLKEMGAAGVIGTEIQVWSQLAQPVGLQLLTHLLNRRSVGEAFLELRKDLLRQLNPLGLAYSYYAPATLHLHVDDQCQWCTAHGV